MSESEQGSPTEQQPDQAATGDDTATGEPKTSAESSVVKDKSKDKVEVLLKSAGDAPIIKKKKWALDPNKNIGFIIGFIKKLIKCDPQESLFLYVNQSFAPSPDVEVGTLYECFGSDGKLILHYCRTQAWG